VLGAAVVRRRGGDLTTGGARGVAHRVRRPYSNDCGCDGFTTTHAGHGLQPDCGDEMDEPSVRVEGLQLLHGVDQEITRKKSGLCCWNFGRQLQA
jgi:hypothetical protein